MQYQKELLLLETSFGSTVLSLFVLFVKEYHTHIKVLDKNGVGLVGKGIDGGKNRGGGTKPQNKTMWKLRFVTAF